MYKSIQFLVVRYVLRKVNDGECVVLVKGKENYWTTHDLSYDVFYRTITVCWIYMK